MNGQTCEGNMFQRTNPAIGPGTGFFQYRNLLFGILLFLFGVTKDHYHLIFLGGILATSPINSKDQASVLRIYLLICTFIVLNQPPIQFFKSNPFQEMVFSLGTGYGLILHRFRSTKWARYSSVLIALITYFYIWEQSVSRIRCGILTHEHIYALKYAGFGLLALMLLNLISSKQRRNLSFLGLPAFCLMLCFPKVEQFKSMTDLNASVRVLNVTANTEEARIMILPTYSILDWISGIRSEPFYAPPAFEDLKDIHAYKPVRRDRSYPSEARTCSLWPARQEKNLCIPEIPRISYQQAVNHWYLDSPQLSFIWHQEEFSTPLTVLAYEATKNRVLKAQLPSERYYIGCIANQSRLACAYLNKSLPSYDHFPVQWAYLPPLEDWNIYHYRK